MNMNPLGLYTEQLAIKPTDLECHPVIVNMGAVEGILIVDERGAEYNDESFKNKLRQSKLQKVSVKGTEKEIEKEIDSGLVPLSKKIRKLTDATLRGLEEGVQEHIEGDEFAIELPTSSRRKRKTAKPLKGIETFGPGSMIQIGDTPMSMRLPRREPAVNISSSAYYLNNREIFVNFLNDLFEPYRQELLDDSKGISCANIGNQSQDFSLLTHQKIVRDYLNLYTPYRGLLLYHGLGSGKTCTSIAIAEGMKSGKQVIIMTPASLKRNYME